jgi:transcriptional regulator with XRE-family HTH domain
MNYPVARIMGAGLGAGMAMNLMIVRIMAMDERKPLGGRIKHLRQLRGHTQEQFAERIEINPKYLSSIERGAENTTLGLFHRRPKVCGWMFTSISVDGPQIDPRRLAAAASKMGVAGSDESQEKGPENSRLTAARMKVNSHKSTNNEGLVREARCEPTAFGL